MEEVIRGVVLGGVNYGENDKILNIFTLEKGILSARIKGVKKAGAKLKFASEPFCFIEFVFSRTGDRRTVIGASLIDSFYPIREDIKRYYSATTVTEFVRAFSQENVFSPDLFVLLCQTLKTLAYGNDSACRVVSEFLIKALSIVGYGLNLNGCGSCGCLEITGRTYFDYNSGCFYCDDCFNGAGREIQNTTYLAFCDLQSDLPVSDQSLTKVLKLLDYYVTNKTETVLKSLKELLSLCSVA